MTFFPQIRNDDVLQSSDTLTAHQHSDLRGTDLFSSFLEADKIFAERNYVCTLAVIAEGIHEYPQWVKHIKKNLSRYDVQLHGMTHRNYKSIDRKKFVFEIGSAKNFIEETFGKQVSVWYPPWGRKGEPEYGKEACEHLGLTMFEQHGKVDAKLWFKNPRGYPHVNFHFWNKTQAEHVRRIICQLTEKPSLNG